MKQSVFFLVILLLISPSMSTSAFMLSQESSEVCVIPDDLEPGDLLFCEIKTFSYTYTDPGWDHVALYIGNNTFIDASRHGGVRRISLDSLERFTKEMMFGTVQTANQTQKEAAVAFVKQQLGKPFDYYEFFFVPWLNRAKNADINASSWYCSELIWAAYLNQGIDIDVNSWNYPPYVPPTEISSDDDVKMFAEHPLNQWQPGMYATWLMQCLTDWLING